MDLNVFELSLVAICAGALGAALIGMLFFLFEKVKPQENKYTEDQKHAASQSFQRMSACAAVVIALIYIGLFYLWKR